MWVAREDDLDAVTALSGSGPAYVFYFVEAMMQAAAEMGLSEAQGRQLALATFSGAAALAQGSADAPSVLRERVTSKGGTTHAAITALEAAGVKEAFVRACTRRACARRNWATSSARREGRAAAVAAGARVAEPPAVRAGRFEVQTLREGVARLLPGERSAMASASGRHWVREVILRVDGVPVVWARSVTPCRATCGPWRAVRQLGTRPLAQLLFDDPSVARSALRSEVHSVRRLIVATLGDARTLTWRSGRQPAWPSAVVAGRSSVFIRAVACRCAVFRSVTPTTTDAASVNACGCCRPAGQALCARCSGLWPPRDSAQRQSTAVPANTANPTQWLSRKALKHALAPARRGSA